MMYLKLKNYLQIIRPYQWIKNVLLFVPVFFSGKVSVMMLGTVLGASLCFCFASSMGYIFNDWFDKERDSYHVIKCKRPLCSGVMNGLEAVLVSVLLLISIICVLFIFEFPVKFLIYLCLYFVLTYSYSGYIKNVVILELFVISSGFVVRVLAGGGVSNIEISSWLFLTVFFMSMMISVAKRKNEMDLLGDMASLHRNSQNGYSDSYLSKLLWSSGSIALVVYALYTVEKGGAVVFSVIPATYGILRFLLLTESGKGGDPIKALFEDSQLLFICIIFIIYNGLIIHLSNIVEILNYFNP